MERNYDHLIERIRILNRPDMTFQVLETIAGYPVYTVHLRANQKIRRRILLSAGTHGDEPAGPEAVVYFLEQNNRVLTQEFDFTILPCINPYGYVHNTRKNHAGIDINRSFENDRSQEAVLLKKVFQNQRFDLFIEFHEDWEYDGFYLFEECRDRAPIGPEIIAQVRTLGPIYSAPTLDDFPVSDGVVSPDLEAHKIGFQAMPLYMLRFHTNHILTSETPLRWNLEKRVSTHLMALDVALSHYRNNLR